MRLVLIISILLINISVGNAQFSARFNFNTSTPGWTFRKSNGSTYYPPAPNTTIQQQLATPASLPPKPPPYVKRRDNEMAGDEDMVKTEKKSGGKNEMAVDEDQFAKDETPREYNGMNAPDRMFVKSDKQKGPTTTTRQTSQLQRLMNQADRIKVPPPSWEALAFSAVEKDLYDANNKIRRERIKELNLWGDALIAGFDIVCPSDNMQMVVHLVVMEGIKPVIAGAEGANIFLIKTTAKYERALSMLKNKETGPEFAMVLKQLREKKPVTSRNAEMIRFAKELLNKNFGNTALSIAWQASLSNEAKGAFLAEAMKNAIELVNEGTRGVIGTLAQNRFAALRSTNEAIASAERLLPATADPYDRQQLEAYINYWQEQMRPFDLVPGALYSWMEIMEAAREPVE